MVYSTAGDVLAATHSRVTARVKKALSDAAKQSESKEQQRAAEQLDNKKPSPRKPASSSSTPSSRLLDGVSPALLERVRCCDVHDCS